MVDGPAGSFPGKRATDNWVRALSLFSNLLMDSCFHLMCIRGYATLEIAGWPNGGA
jgi:hypothetical protein